MDNNALDIDWANIVDLLASEYGWTLDYISTLDMGQVLTLMKAIKKRYAKQNPQGDYPDIPENLENAEKEMPISDFIKMGGKEVEKNGKKQIII